MDTDLYVGINGGTFCKKLKVGVIDVSTEKSMIDVTIRGDINSIDSTDCESAPVNVPNITCPPSITIQPKYPFEVGDPITNLDVLYGFYEFRSAADFNPDAVKLALDIASYPANYSTSPYNPNGVKINIDSTTSIGNRSVYHVIRVPFNVNLVIKDVTQLTITNAFKVLSDVQYNFYLLDRAIAPSDIEYTLS